MIAFSSQLQKDYVPRWYIVIFGMNAFGTVRIACAEVIGDFAELVHQKEAKFIFQDCGGESIKTKLILKIKKVELLAPTITFVNEDSYHLSFYGYQCNTSVNPIFDLAKFI